MTQIWHFVLCCVLFECSLAQHVIKTISVNNGGTWGTWKPAEFCPPGKFAVGYQMKIERRQKSGDDTSLNGIKLNCNGGATITSGVGPWGDWGTMLYCKSSEAFVVLACKLNLSRGMGTINVAYHRCGESSILTLYKNWCARLATGSKKDDTAANFVKFLCRNIRSGNTEVKVQSPGDGYWGRYGGWSLSCDLGSAICGLQTRIEGPQGKNDDTALNDVRSRSCIGILKGGAVCQDDTAANFVKFLCRDNDGGNTEVRVAQGGKGFWGDYGGWSLPCDPGSAICGLETRVERPQGNGDDTSLNAVRFFCCDD